MSEVQEKTNPFSEPGVTSDVVLLVEGRQLHVNKTILAVASPVFEKMFFGEFKETHMAEVPLPEKRFDDIVQFLLCIYPSTAKSVTEKNIDALLSLAEEYDVVSLKERCCLFLRLHLQLSGGTLSKEEILHYMNLATQYGLSDILEECLVRAVHFEYGRDSGLGNLEEFSQLSGQTTIAYLSRRLKRLEDLIRPILVTSYSGSGQLLEDLNFVISNECFDFTHRRARHTCRECRATCCGRCRKLATSAMEDLSHAIKNILQEFK